MVVGLIAAVLVSLIALGIFVLEGPEPFEASETTFGRAVLLYLVSGLVAGLLVGLLLPLATWRFGAVVLGILGAATFYVPVALSQDSASIIDGAIAAVFVGSIVGYALWSPLKSERSSQS